MKLTKGQSAYIIKRRKEIEEILKYKPKNGWFGLEMEWDMLNNLMKVHNIAVREENDASTTNSTSKQS